MNKGLVIAGAVVVAVIAIGAFYLVDIDQTQEARLPDVDVSVEGGQLPEFDAEVGSIEVVSEEVVVEVPEVEVTMEETVVEVPSLQINTPDDETSSN